MSVSYPSAHPQPISFSEQPNPDSNSELLPSPSNRAENRRRRLEARQKFNKKQKEPVDPYTPFFVPDSLLERSSRCNGSNSDNTQEDPTAQSQSHTASPFLNLPTEILLLIVDHLSIPYFQVSLALTCKRLATILSQNRTRISPWRGYLDKDGLYRLLTKPSRRLSTSDSPSTSTSTLTPPPPRPRQFSLIELPSTLPTHTPHNSDPYIPTTLRLCRACFRHVPHDPIYWQRKMRGSEYDWAEVNWNSITSFFGENRRGVGQHKCPECSVRGYLAFVNEGAWANWTRPAGEDDWEELEGVRACPGLRGRLGRP